MSLVAALSVFVAAFVLAALVAAGYAAQTRGGRLGNTLAELDRPAVWRA